MSDVMRILFTGSRHMTEARPIARALSVLLKSLEQPQELVFIHGAAEGCDTLVEGIATAHSARVERYPADWQNRGNAAGPERNAKMVQSGASICLAFPTPQSAGTWDCIRRAAGAGIPVRIYPVKL